MADIIIHRCTLRVVRRSGWSWGPGPQQLLKAAVAALPFLIARKLGELFPDDTNTEISERVRLTIPIKLSELLALGSEAAGYTETSLPPSAARLDQRLIAAVARGFEKELPTLKKREVAALEIHEHAPDLEAEQPELEKTRGHHVLRLLLGWQRQGELNVHLAEFTEQELEVWYSALLATILELASTSKAVRPEVISQAVHDLTQRLERSAWDRVTALRLILLTVLEVGAQLQQESTDEVAVREVFAQVFASFDQRHDDGPTKGLQEFAIEAPVENERSQTILKLPEPAISTPVREVPTQRVAKTEFHIRSVLPYLLLGPLARIGYLDALAATLEALGLSPHANAFATALAFKVLSPPARGWRRPDQDLAVAAAFAGVESPPAGDALAELARKLSGHLTALDSLVTYTLVKGHRPGKPLLLYRTGEETGSAGLLLVEMDGLFPVAWAADLQALLPTLKYFNETHLLIQHLSADVETLRALDTAGYRFITDAPPTRGEPWRELRAPRQRWYSNDPDAKESTLLRAAEQLAGTAEETELIWRALKVDRPSLPTARHSELERTLTMAASLALGAISWTLWRDVETVTPVLALERFGNLDGKVRFTSSAVQVHLPLGQRQRDLYEHQLLADVHNIPWLDGRTVEFFGG